MNSSSEKRSSYIWAQRLRKQWSTFTYHSQESHYLIHAVVPTSFYQHVLAMKEE